MSPIDVRRGVESRIGEICREILGCERVELDAGFLAQGGNSMSFIRYVAAVHRSFDVELATEAIMDAETLRDVADLVVEGLAASSASPRGGEPAPDESPLGRWLSPRHEPVTGPVPLLANRFSYFLRREAQLERWSFDSGILDLHRPLEDPELARVLEHLVTHHDGLRLQLAREGDGWVQRIVPPEMVEPLAVVEHDGSGGVDGFAERTLAEVRRAHLGFTFPGELFTGLVVRDRKRGAARLALVVHHLLLDAFSARLVFDDFFELYRQASSGAPLSLPPTSTSLPGFARASTEYWLGRAAEEARYWRSLAWETVRPLPVPPGAVETSNLERHTVHAVRRIPVSDPEELIAAVGRRPPRTFADTVLHAIARAFGDWTGHDGLHLAMAFHGREAFHPRLDLTRTAGWISEAVPLVLSTRGTGPVALEPIRAQRERAERRGKSYGVLRHLAPRLSREGSYDELRDLPRPEVSLNMKLPGIGHERISDIGSRVPRGHDEIAGDARRVFLLSGGVFFEDEDLVVSWDFSDRVLDRRQVETFTARCAAHLEEAFAECLGRPFATGTLPATGATLDNSECEAIDTG